MDIVKLLPEYLDIGLEEGELEDLTRLVLQKQLRALKESIAVQVVNARSAMLMDDLEGSNRYLSQARKFKNQYHHFLAELQRLNKDESEVLHVTEPETLKAAWPVDLPK
jgi:hypothetical protein